MIIKNAMLKNPEKEIFNSVLLSLMKKLLIIKYPAEINKQMAKRFGKKVGPGNFIPLNSYFGNLEVSTNTKIDIKTSIPAKILSPIFKFSPSLYF